MSKKDKQQFEHDLEQSETEIVEMTDEEKLLDSFPKSFSCSDEEFDASMQMVRDFGLPQYTFAIHPRLKDDKQFLPTKADPEATGYDVRAAVHSEGPMVIKPFQHVKIPLGIRGYCPPGWWYELKPRSSTFAKKYLHCLYGTIDETYEGELVLAVQYIPEFTYSKFGELSFYADGKLSKTKDLEINYGDAVAQIVPVKRQEMKVLEATNEELDELFKNRNGQRGDGGFGSTTTPTGLPAKPAIGFIKFGDKK